MEGVPLEYIWQYNPVTGRVAGANQNYGERINILSANRYLYNRMQAVQARHNANIIDKGFNSISGMGCPCTSLLPPIAETAESDEAFTGGSVGEERPDAATSIKTKVSDLVLAAEEAAAQRNQNLTAEKFVRQFPPVVYSDPFNGPPFPQEFNPLFSPDGNQFSRPLHGGAVSLSGYYPKLRGGSIVLRGPDPALG